MTLESLKRFVVPAVVAMLTAACHLHAAEPETSGAPPLRVGVAPVSPPMIFKQGSKVVGVEADLAEALGKELGRPIKFVELDFEELLNALNEDKIDIVMSSMSVTRSRQFRATFSEPYLRVGQMALVRADDKFRYALLENGLSKQTLGMKKGTTADLLAQQEFSRAKRKYYKSSDDGAKAVKKKQIDLFIDDSTMIGYLAGIYEAEGLVAAPMVMSDEILGWAMRRADVPLQKSVNDFLKKSLAGGELNGIVRRWVPKLQ